MKVVPIVLHGVGSSKMFDDISLDIFNEILKNVQSNALNDNQGQVEGFRHLLTFDDGLESDYWIAYPSLLRAAIKSIHFISPSFVGKNGYLTWSQVREMSAAGLDFGSHSMTHPKLSALSVEQVRWELDYSRKIIEDRLGRAITSLSFPFGDYSQSTIDIALDVGYKNCFHSMHGIWNGVSCLIPRNSINRSMSFKKVGEILNPSFMQSYKWIIEDVTKKRLKLLLGDSFYRLIRDIIY